MGNSPCFRTDLAECRTEQVFQCRWAVDCESICLTKGGLSGIGGRYELSQINESRNAGICSQLPPNERKSLKRKISKMEIREFQACCIHALNLPSSEAKARLFAHWAPFAFDRPSSVESLGMVLSPIMSLFIEFLQRARSGPLSKSWSAGQEGSPNNLTVLLRNCLIETELDCSATEGGPGAS